MQRVEDFRNKDGKRSLVAPIEGAVVVREVEVADQQSCQPKKFTKMRQSPMFMGKKTSITAQKRLLQVVEHRLAVASKDVEEEGICDVIRLNGGSPFAPPDPEVFLEHLGEEVQEQKGSHQAFLLVLLVRVLLFGLPGPLLNLLHHLLQEEPAAVDVFAVGEVKLLEKHLTLKISERRENKDEPGVSVLGAGLQVEEEEGGEVGVGGRHHRVVGLLEEQGAHHDVQHLAGGEGRGGGLGAEPPERGDGVITCDPFHHGQLFFRSGETG